MEAIVNKKARHDFFIEETFEAGVMLEGWELKSILKRKANMDLAHVHIRNGELFLFNAVITPLQTTSTHVKAESTRNRKLLMKKQEIMRLIGKVERSGYTLIPLKIYLKGKIKVEIALAKGKKQYDKRESAKQADWDREKAQIMKKSAKSV